MSSVGETPEGNHETRVGGDLRAGKIERMAEKMGEALRSSLSDDEQVRSDLREVVSELGALQARVAEWSALHHLLHEIWVTFSLFRVRLVPPGEQGFGASERQALLQSWKLCQIKLDALADFAGEIGHIGAPLRREGRALGGESWAVEIMALQLLFEDALKESDLDPASLLELAQEFDSACHRHLAMADRRLRATVDKLQRLSTRLLGGIV